MNCPEVIRKIKEKKKNLEETMVVIFEEFLHFVMFYAKLLTCIVLFNCCNNTMKCT